MKKVDYDLSIHSNPDAQAWAQFFMKTMKENPDHVIDEELMIGWFANAMMAMHDFIKKPGPINGDHAQHLLDTKPKWKTCFRCTTQDFCTNRLHGCDIEESLESGIEPLAGY